MWVKLIETHALRSGTCWCSPTHVHHQLIFGCTSPTFQSVCFYELHSYPLRSTCICFVVIVVLYLPLQYLGFRLFHLLSTFHTYPLISRVCFGVAFGSLKFKSPAFLCIGFSWHGPLVPILSTRWGWFLSSFHSTYIYTCLVIDHV